MLLECTDIYNMHVLSGILQFGHDYTDKLFPVIALNDCKTRSWKGYIIVR